jgi:two-component system NarL family sensor kinase
MQERLQKRLDEAEETLRALRSGEVDAIVATGPGGERVYTLKGADEAYRLMVQNMAEGALTVAPTGLILFSNETLASILGIPLERVIGASLHDFIVPEDAGVFAALIAPGVEDGARGELRLKTRDDSPVPVYLSISHLQLDEVDCLCVIVTDLTRRKRSEDALRALSARLLQVQDEERHRIARALHDGAFQRLAALEFKLTLAGGASPGLPQPLQQTLAECMALVGECCNELSSLAYVLHPPLLDELGLGPALKAYAAGYSHSLGREITLDLPSELERLPVDVETNLFRIAQEALTNIDRHSDSARAEIRLLIGPGELLLEVTDHGGGILQGTLEQLNDGGALPGVGIPGMRERARQLGGRLEVDSSTVGTTVRVKLPAK